MDFLKKEELYSSSLKTKQKISPDLAQASLLMQSPPKPHVPLQDPAHPHYHTFERWSRGRADPDPGQLRDSRVTTEG